MNSFALFILAVIVAKSAFAFYRPVGADAEEITWGLGAVAGVLAVGAIWDLI